MRSGKTCLPHGLGRSYGDSCQNENGVLIQTTSMDRLIEFDSERGLLRAEAGISLREIARLVLPHGWFHAVTPGTQYVTLGGAIANDVHGKNHHIAGNYGHHVKAFELLRSDGSRLLCSTDSNMDYFFATIGGLGLTGLITWAEIQMKPVPGEWLEVEYFPFKNIAAFHQVNQANESRYEYVVAWLDCLARGGNLGRGILMCGNHAATHPTGRMPSGKTLRLPFDFPNWALNPLSVRLFNTVYRQAQVLKAGKKRLVHYQPFFYPLDAIQDWNRMYGKRGFLQFQCVLPSEAASSRLHFLLSLIAESGQASFLAVLKRFGAQASLGMLSFPRPGVTLALDFPMRGESTLALLRQMEDIVVDAGGAIYPAKDSCMSAKTFQQAYPQWQTFSRYIDPAFSSSFWRRVTDSA